MTLAFPRAGFLATFPGSSNTPLEVPGSAHAMPHRVRHETDGAFATEKLQSVPIDFRFIFSLLSFSL